MTNQPPIKILLDTDIGDDIDDAIALSFALGSPEFELLGVTVVYGDVQTRGRIARKMLRLAGRGDVPVHLGCERPFGWDYHPGTAPENCSQRLAVADEPDVPPTPGAAQFIADTVRRHPGQVHLLTIGAKTNVAATLCAEPSLVKQIAGIVSLAGYLPPRLAEPEWNVRYDPLAAQTIARSGVAWTVVGANVQGGNGLTGPEFKALAASGRPCAKFLLELVVLMSRYKGRGNPAIKTIQDVKGVHVADVMSMASFLVGDQMRFQRGRADVDGNGALRFQPDPAGPHRLATAALPEGPYRQEILRRLLAAGPR